MSDKKCGDVCELDYPGCVGCIRQRTPESLKCVECDFDENGQLTNYERAEGD